MCISEAVGNKVACVYQHVKKKIQLYTSPEPSTVASLASVGGCTQRGQCRATFLPSLSRKWLPQPWLLSWRRALSSAELDGNGKPQGFLEGKLSCLIRRFFFFFREV